MGISGLLPFLKDATTNVNIKDFAGSTVAIDTYCWIYRGAFSCAEELALGHPTDGHVKYVLRYVTKLLEWDIKPVMVFDGSCLPSKKGTEQKRKESKEMYRKKAAQCLAEGKRNEARECFQRCIECTPKMALEVIQAMHKIGVDVLVAPYEADAQLAYLNKINVAQIVITEDSDLILFGCEKVLYKMDLNGNGQLIQKEKIISITQFDSADNFERFRWMCILSGCDYLENLPGIGLGKAKKLLKSINKTDIEPILKQMSKVLKMPSLVVTNDYIEFFKRADKTFKFQLVFDPLKRKLTPINSYENKIDPESEDLSYAGIYYEESLALQHSLGNIGVNNREVVYNFNPEKWTISTYKPPHKFLNNPPAHMKSIWSKSYATMSNSNPFVNYFQKKEEEAIKNLPKTIGMTKSIATINQKNSPSRYKPITVSAQSDKSLLKRKHKELEESKNDHSENSGESTGSNSNDSNKDKVNEKRLKLQDNKIALDEMLSQYSSSSKSTKTGYSTSSYFSSNSKATSPILNKNGHFSNFSSEFQMIKSDSQNVEFSLTLSSSDSSSSSNMATSQEPYSPLHITKISRIQKPLTAVTNSVNISSPILVNQGFKVTLYTNSEPNVETMKIPNIEMSNRILSDMNEMRTTDKSTNLLAQYQRNSSNKMFIMHQKDNKVNNENVREEINNTQENKSENSFSIVLDDIDQIKLVKSEPSFKNKVYDDSKSSTPTSTKKQLPFKKPGNHADNKKTPQQALAGNVKPITDYFKKFEYTKEDKKFKMTEQL